MGEKVRFEIGHDRDETLTFEKRWRFSGKFQGGPKARARPLHAKFGEGWRSFVKVGKLYLGIRHGTSVRYPL